MSLDLDELGFDPDALREKYRTERDKRLRPEGIGQYIHIDDEFPTMLDDPHVTEPLARDAIDEHLDAVVIGAGFCGLLSGARLRQAGVENLRMIEAAADVGGTWYWNQYPGVQCDIESYIYLSLLEELDYMPRLKYAYGPEIRNHAQNIAHRFDLYDGALFQTWVTHLAWDTDADRWIVSTNRGDRLAARFVVVGNGPLSKPKLPGLRGIEDFGGKMFHTSRWDYEYTGGDTAGGLSKLADKKVGIVGTGATAIQCIPHLGEAAEHLYVFQRTPSSVDVRNNRPTDEEWVASLEPGWQEERIANFSILTSGGMATEDLVSDGWTDIIRKFSGMANKNRDGAIGDMALLAELADFEKMEEIRARVDEFVNDPAIADSLKPWYRQFCKRPCFHDDYLPTFTRDNVTLVDTDGKGVERLTRDAVVVGGEEYEVDCLIFATGFEVGTDYSRRASMEIRGIGGVTLTEHWEDGITTLHGLMTNDFPNLFLMGGMQSGVTPNFTELYNEQSRHVAYIVREGLEQPEQVIEAQPDAVAAWVQTVADTANPHSTFARNCTPGYYNNEGQPGQGPGWFGGNFMGGAQAFFAILRDWRERGDLAGMERR
ncbi:MAG: NAD(P)/FAD-dependent oxidoreductase [Acidimicrobiaceae bacterium]|nr:NAD(P)/FAD-dependent oxidoreductase [Acidimicrobiaceae bacterium]MYG55269.1 NAD(P)/FAD-dependent oxidoreductase [Acidimicrobiaceae bacterium]MYJ99655.1 NAD(P)/FAD-dependent oxidoreductase [Acidimicrobiaceae bacterium]